MSTSACRHRNRLCLYKLPLSLYPTLFCKPFSTATRQFDFVAGRSNELKQFKIALATFLKLRRGALACSTNYKQANQSALLKYLFNANRIRIGSKQRQANDPHFLGEKKRIWQT